MSVRTTIQNAAFGSKRPRLLGAWPATTCASSGIDTRVALMFRLFVITVARAFFGTRKMSRS